MNLKHEKIPKIILDDSQVYDVELYKIKEVKVQKKTILIILSALWDFLVKGTVDVILGEPPCTKCTCPIL